MEQIISTLKGRSMSSYTQELIESLSLAKAAQECLMRAVVGYFGGSGADSDERGLAIYKDEGAEAASENFIEVIERMIGESISLHLDDYTGTEF